MLENMTNHPMTPEHRALIARRTLAYQAKILCLCARGNGVTDARIKALILSMRSPKLAVLTDDEAAEIIRDLELEVA